MARYLGGGLGHCGTPHIELRCCLPYENNLGRLQNMSHKSGIAAKKLMYLLTALIMCFNEYHTPIVFWSSLTTLEALCSPLEIIFQEEYC